MDKIKTFLERWWGMLALLAISPLCWLAAQRLARFTDIPNSNFLKIWLAGRMTWTGGDPYSAVDWLNGHLAAGSNWVPERGFLYPLPLAYLLSPLGLFSVRTGYILWAFLSMLACAAAVILLVNAWEENRLKVFCVLLLVAIFLFVPTLETIGKGTIGALLLLLAVFGIELFRRKKPFFGGFVLAFLLLKPQLGVPILAGLGLWLCARRDWRTLSGMATGAIVLFLIGAAGDAHWVSKFLEASGQKLGGSFGSQPTLASLAALTCAGAVGCTFWIGSLASLALATPVIWLLLRRANELSALEAFNLAAPLGLLVTPYLWSYDHLLLAGAFVWLAHQLILRTKKYTFAMLFLVAMDVAAGVAFYLTGARPEKDFWNIAIPLITLLAILAWSWPSRPNPVPHASNDL